jgi:hypothetical protein
MTIPESDGSEKPWYQVSFEELRDGCPDGVEPQWLAGELPAWAAKAYREILKTVNPTAQLRDELEVTPRMLGGVLGHQIAAWNEMMSVAGQSEAAAKLVGVMLMPPKEHLEAYPKTFATYVDGLVDAMKRTCGRAIESDYAECVEFFDAFARGMKTRPSETTRTNTTLLFLLAVLWKQAEACSSIREVHTWLCKLLPPQMVGDLKRIEKLCQRIGFRVRGKGRPSKKPPKG